MLPQIDSARSDQLLQAKYEFYIPTIAQHCASYIFSNVLMCPTEETFSNLATRQSVTIFMPNKF